MCQKILVDADACPVKAEIKQVAEHFQLDVIFVASFNHYSVNTNGENWILWILEKNQRICE